MATGMTGTVLRTVISWGPGTSQDTLESVAAMFRKVLSKSSLEACPCYVKGMRTRSAMRLLSR